MPEVKDEVAKVDGVDAEGGEVVKDGYGGDRGEKEGAAGEVERPMGGRRKKKKEKI